MEISSREIPTQDLEVWPPHPLSPLQYRTEALIELLLYQAKEGGGKGGFLVGLRPQPRDDPRCLLQEEEHLECDGVNTVISQKHRAKYGPSLELGRCLVPACDGGDLLLSYQQTSVREGS